MYGTEKIGALLLSHFLTKQTRDTVLPTHNIIYFHWILVKSSNLSLELVVHSIGSL